MEARTTRKSKPDPRGIREPRSFAVKVETTIGEVHLGGGDEPPMVTAFQMIARHQMSTNDGGAVYTFQIADHEAVCRVDVSWTPTSS